MSPVIRAKATHSLKVDEAFWTENIELFKEIQK
jgi:hypothetical protein